MSTDGLQVVSSFFDLAPKLRSTFEQKFSRPLTATEDRFVWDYWYVENQYKLIHLRKVSSARSVAVTGNY